MKRMMPARYTDDIVRSWVHGGCNPLLTAATGAYAQQWDRPPTTTYGYLSDDNDTQVL